VIGGEDSERTVGKSNRGQALYDVFARGPKATARDHDATARDHGVAARDARPNRISGVFGRDYGALTRDSRPNALERLLAISRRDLGLIPLGGDEGGKMIAKPWSEEGEGKEKGLFSVTLRAGCLGRNG